MNTEALTDRELDAKVAKLMGWTHMLSGPVAWQGDINPRWWAVSPEGKGAEIPHYSTDIAAASLILDQMYAKGWGIELQRWHGGPDPQDWWEVSLTIDTEHTATAPTLPRAICQAALKAVE